MNKKKINFAVVGCGRVSRKHLESIQKNPRATLLAVCDCNFKKVSKAKKEYGVHYAYTEYGKLLKNKDIDVINICTPSGLHPKMIIAAAKANKNILVEKPLSLNLKEAIKSVEIVKKQNKLLGVVFQNRCNFPIKYVYEKLKKNLLGNILLITATVRWYRPPSYYKDEWHGRKNMDGGILFNQAIHFVDMLLYLMNKEVKSVYCTSSTLAHNIEIDDVALVNIKFNDGTLGVVEASTISYPKNMEGSITLQCEKATVEVGGRALDKVVYWEGKSKPKIPIICSRKDKEDIYGTGHYEVINNMVDAIRNKKKLICDGDNAIKTIKVIEKAYLSSIKRKEVKL